MVVAGQAIVHISVITTASAAITATTVTHLVGSDHFRTAANQGRAMPGTPTSRPTTHHAVSWTRNPATTVTIDSRVAALTNPSSARSPGDLPVLLSGSVGQSSGFESLTRAP